MFASVSSEFPPRWSQPSYRPVVLGEYLKMGEEFIASAAPTLSPELRHRLTKEVCMQQMGLQEPVYRGEFADPVLKLNQAWLWPELVKISPFTLDDFNVFPRDSLWEGTQWHAYFAANCLRDDTESWDIRNWVFSVPMTQVREWRNKFLPNRAKRGSKFNIVLDLVLSKSFVAEAEKRFNEWRRDQFEEVDRLMEIAHQQPVARHLAWLSYLLECRLDAHHSAVNSIDGPEAYADYVRDQVESAAGGVRLDLAPVRGEVASTLGFFDSIYSEQVQEIAVQLAMDTIELMRPVITTPKTLEAELTKYTPNKLAPRHICDRCAAGLITGRLKSGRKKLAPYHLLCTCRGLRWEYVPKKSEDPLKAYDAKNRRDLHLWAIDQLLGTSLRHPPVAALLSIARGIDFDKHWREQNRLSKHS